MEKQTKKDWKKPELIVLVRSKPEETVLLQCKHDFSNGPYQPLTCNVNGVSCDQNKNS